MGVSLGPRRLSKDPKRKKRGATANPGLLFDKCRLENILLAPPPFCTVLAVRQWAFDMCLEQAAGDGLRQKRNQDLNHILSPFVRQRCRQGDQGGFEGGGSQCTAFLRQTCRSVLGHFGDEKIMGLGEAVSVMDALCHGSHIDKCYHDSVGTSVHLRGSLSVEERELKS
ncbi:unnamed protein product [Prunus armeniaca]|uniref:Uncharacterized protein n=1 Tax=Prunus armeniaca TaxID=36596 RepID=A0A6J5X973_PRUAR|nr:unnamed protein product [Prunus armeniaca]